MAVYADLREWMSRIDEAGELRVVRGARWQDEIGAIADLTKFRPNGPAVLLDDVEGYPSGYRLLVNPLNSVRRTAITLGMPLDLSPAEYVELCQQRLAQVSLLPPEIVPDGPVYERVQRGQDVNLLQFPTPHWHPDDGGRYLGTGSVTITRDPDDGWLNLGTYRMMVLDEQRISLWISPGHHGRIHYERYWSQGKPCPVVVSCGHDPLLFMAGSMDVPFGTSEYDYAGGLRGAPFPLVLGETGIPFPAGSEIVLEGECRPQEKDWDGPFGEWTGYYASGAVMAPVMHVSAVYHRENPIILGASPARPPAGVNLWYSFMKAGLVRRQLQAAGVPGVTGVWYHPVGGVSLLMAVGVKQMYPGHARQAGQVAAFCGAGAYMGRYTIVVDEDIDVYNLDEVLWALCTRSDPQRSIAVLDRCWSGPLDPAIPEEEAGFNSRAIIDATKPWEWRDKFPKEIRMDKDVERRVLEKWGQELFGISQP